MATQKDVTVYIGRFNPFHLGHAHVLLQALKTSKSVLVLIGSAFKARSPKNPFTYDERRKMVSWWYHDLLEAGHKLGSLRIQPIADHASNNTWIKMVQSTVRREFPNASKIHLTGSDRDNSTWYLRAFPQWEQDLVTPFRQSEDLSATSVRTVLYNEKMTMEQFQSLEAKLPKTSMDFILDFILRPVWDEKDRINGMRPIVWLRQQHRVITESRDKWKDAPHPVTFNTADAVIIQSGHVLVVRRGNQPGLGLIALPGGYINQHERIKDAAVREAIEETGISLATGKKAAEITERMLRGSIRAFEIFDDPNRSERGRIITVAYLMRLDDTKPLPLVAGQNVPMYEANGKVEVETLEAFWLPLDKAIDNPEIWFEDHYQIISHFVSMVDD